MKPVKPFIVLVATLFVMILLIPTLLVIPFSEKADGTLAEELKKQNQIKPETQKIESEEAIEVAVHRASTQTIENISLEEYVVGVLAMEMPAEFELEALKAQSLAARTYVVRRMISEDKLDNDVPEGADVSDTTFHQVYKNNEELKEEWGSEYDWKIKKITEAVNATQGEILTYNGAPIDALFYSTSNGYTENAEDVWSNEIPYLKSVPSPWDLNSKKFHAQVSMSVKEFEQKLGVNIGDSNEVGKVTSRTKTNRVATVEIGGKTFTGVDVRDKLKLQSTDFTWQRKGNEIIIQTKGYGHGVGMSQYGADGMAKEGKSYKDIVTYYYKGIEISSADSLLNTLMAKQ